MISFHRNYNALKKGSLKLLAGRPGVIGYGRFDKEDSFVVAINNNDHQEIVDIPVWELGAVDSDAFVRLMETSDEGFTLSAAIYRPEQGVIILRMKPHSGILMKNLPKYLI